MDPRIKARLQQTEQADPLDERVRSYLLERMNAAPEEAPDLSRERQLDALGAAGTNISNIFLNRAGLGPVKAGEGFEAAARRDLAARPKTGAADSLAGNLYEADMRAKLMSEREAGVGARAGAEDERLKAKAAEDVRLKEAQLAQGDKSLALREKLAARKMVPKPAVAPKGPKTEGMAFGFELEEGANPTRRQLEEHQTRVASAAAMKRITGDMKSLLADESAFSRFAPGAARDLLAQLSQEATLEGKNIGQLGALSGPDMGIMEAIITNPTSARSSIKDMKRILEGVDRWVDNREAVQAKSIGVRRKAAGAPATGGKVTVTNGKETLRIDASKVTEAEKDGFKVVK